MVRVACAGEAEGFLAMCGGSPSASVGAERSWTQQAVMPATIGGVLDALAEVNGSINEMCVNGQSVVEGMIVSVVGQVLEVQAMNDAVQYVLYDFTGTINARLYLPAGCRAPVIKVGQYVSVWGPCLWTGQEEFHIGAHVVRVAEGGVFMYHMADAANAVGFYAEADGGDLPRRLEFGSPDGVVSNVWCG